MDETKVGVAALALLGLAQEAGPPAAEPTAPAGEEPAFLMCTSNSKIGGLKARVDKRDPHVSALPPGLIFFVNLRDLTRDDDGGRVSGKASLSLESVAVPTHDVSINVGLRDSGGTDRRSWRLGHIELFLGEVSPGASAMSRRERLKDPDYSGVYLRSAQVVAEGEVGAVVKAVLDDSGVSVFCVASKIH